VIVAGGGDDRIIARRNKDRVCAGPGSDTVLAGTGRDKVYGGQGNDYLDLGPGRDKAKGGGGADTVVGGGGGDKVHPGVGSDRVFGGIQDDKLFGDDGDDLVTGGQGIDKLWGGGGDDWIRGDTNRDRYRGGAGGDTLSFATATPPGRRRSGVSVYLGRGLATGDDARESIKNVENVVGSMFADRLIGRGGGFARGQLGSDSCSGFAYEDCGGSSRRSAVAFVADPGSPDPGLVVMGSAASESWTIRGGGGGFSLSGSGLIAGSACDRISGEVACGSSRAFGYVLIWGGRGDDQISASGLPASVLVKFDGGRGDDRLSGSGNADLLYAGESGRDVLRGRGGDDALVSRAGGADKLQGGGGNDQLVTDSPCDGHLFNGGGGTADVAGFGHVQRRGVKARIGGGAALRGVRHCDRTRIRGSSEVLEGSRFADVLMASNGGDLLIGRDGGDRCVGGHHRRC
jgi:Ca2+-binding RTX toxin-like protein